MLSFDVEECTRELANGFRYNVTIYTNKRYVDEIRRLAEPIEVETMSGLYQLKYSATAKLDGKEVYFAPGKGINIQAAYQYRSQRRIADDGH